VTARLKRAPRPPSTKRKGIQSEHRTRSPRRETHEDVVIASRRTKALDLAIAGASYRQIAAQTCVSIATAYDDVQAELGALDKMRGEQAERLRDLALKRLDKWTLALTPKAQQGDEKAVRVLVSIEDRRSKLLGLDAPTKREHGGTGGAPLTFTLQLNERDRSDRDV
jgi:hypothetical protein